MRSNKNILPKPFPIIALALLLTCSISCKKTDDPAKNPPNPPPTHNTPASAKKIEGKWVKIGDEWLEDNLLQGELVQIVEWQGKEVMLYHGGSVLQRVTRIKVKQSSGWVLIDQQVNGSTGNMAIGADGSLYHLYTDGSRKQYFKRYTGTGKVWDELSSEAPENYDAIDLHRLGNDLYRSTLGFGNNVFAVDKWDGSLWQPVIIPGLVNLGSLFRSVKISDDDALPNTLLFTFSLADGAQPDARRFYSFDGSSLTFLTNQVRAAAGLPAFLVGRSGKWYYNEPTSAKFHSTFYALDGSTRKMLFESEPDRVYLYGEKIGNDVFILESADNLPYPVFNNLIEWDGTNFKRYFHPSYQELASTVYNYYDLRRINGKLTWRVVIRGKLIVEEFRED